MKSLVIPVKARPEVKELPGYNELSETVGGYIEALHFTDTANAYVNEEGKLLDLPFNPFATHLCQTVYKIGMQPLDVINGTLIVVGPVDEEGDDTDVPQAIVDEILKLYDESLPKASEGQHKHKAK
jgi:hypothetical protein